MVFVLACWPFEVWVGLGVTSPILSSWLPNRYFAARGEEGRAQDRPHFVYGDYQRRRKLPPEALARSVDEAWASSLDPLEGEEDRSGRREGKRRGWRVQADGGSGCTDPDSSLLIRQSSTRVFLLLFGVGMLARRHGTVLTRLDRFPQVS